MDALRTPDDRFTDLPAYPFAPHYLEVADGDGGTLRMHYLDEGPADGPVVLLLHGEPSWSYLYRHMVPVLVEAGLRTVVPDLVGFGKSDKPVAVSDLSYARHVEWVRAAVFDVLDLTAVTLVGQDWGGLIGLRLVAEHPDRFARVVAANTGLPTGDHQMPPEWWRFRRVVEAAQHLRVGSLVAKGCRTRLSAEVIAAYDAPFPDETYQAAARAFPLLVPTSPADPATAANRAAWQSLMRFDKPVLTAFSDGDPITRDAEAVLHKLIPGCAGQPHTTIEGAGHFLQEDAGPELARVVARFVRS